MLQALKGAVYTAAVGQLLGYEVFPNVDAERFDLIQAINLQTMQTKWNNSVVACKPILL